MAGRGHGTHAVAAADSTRAIVYCVVPRELAKLHEPLRKWFASQADVEVVVEQRARERRSPGGRRAVAMPAAEDTRRKIRSAEGRRVAERRATAVAIDPLPLPARLRRHAGELGFLRRLEPSAQE